MLPYYRLQNIIPYQPYAQALSLIHIFGVVNFSKKYGNCILKECGKQALAVGRVNYSYIKNSIPAVTEDIDTPEEHSEINAERNKGGFVMGSAAMDIGNLLTKSQKLAQNTEKKGGGRYPVITGESLTNTLVDELNELGLPNMAATLNALYHSERFLKPDHLTLISELITPEYQDKISKRVNNRLRHTKLIGCP